MSGASAFRKTDKMYKTTVEIVWLRQLYLLECSTMENVKTNKFFLTEKSLRLFPVKKNFVRFLLRWA